MSYSAEVIDHFERPRNAGSFGAGEDGVATGLVGAPARGAVIRLQIRVNADGIIEDARFKTFGSAAAIAASSLVSEWVKGKTLAEAAAIRNTEIARYLALPPVEIHSSVLAEDAIKAAVADYRRQHGLDTEKSG